MSVRLHLKTSPQGVDWPTLEATWALAGEMPVFEGGWLNDHLTDPSVDRGGSSFEALTTLAALAHHLPGRWVGHIVLSNTFRHPAVLAKAATTLDHATGGRFILGLGAGWHEHEHADFGIELPPIGERISRLASSVRVIRALGSPAASSPDGVSLADPHYPLTGAVNLPAPLTPGGPALWLGGQGPRAARSPPGRPTAGSCRHLPFVEPETFAVRRDHVVRELQAAGRDVGAFRFGAQVPSGRDDDSLARARQLGLAYAVAGATDLVLALPAGLGPDGLRRLERHVALPLRDQLG